MEALSGGMRRRLTIARSLLNEPEILLLDEPTTGLDPQARHVLWDRLFRLKQQGVTLILTTHYMDEAEQLCDRLVVMDKGRIVAEGSPRDLITRYSTREVLELRFAIGEQATAEEKVRAAGAERIEALPDRLLWYADDGEAALATAHRLGLDPGDRPGPALHIGGCLPRPDRPDAGGLMAIETAVCPRGHAIRMDYIRREYDYWWRQYRRRWRGTIVISVANPILFLIAIGAGIGRLVTPSADSPAAAALGGVTYLAFFAPGMLAAASMQNGIIESAPRSSAAGCADGPYQPAITSPLEPVDILLGHMLFMAVRIAMSAAAFLVVMVAMGAAHSWLVVLTLPAATLTGLAFATPTRPGRCHSGRSRPRQRPVQVGGHADVPVLRHVLRHRPVARLGCSPWSQLTPLWHGVDLCRTLSLGTATWTGSAVHVGYLVAAHGARSGAGRSDVPHAPAPVGGAVAHLIVLRHLWVLRRNRPYWLIVNGVFEPFLYLMSIGVGIGQLVTLPPGSAPPGTSYAAFVAPAHAGHGGDERRVQRDDRRRVVAAAVREGLPVDAHHADDGHRHRRRRGGRGDAASQCRRDLLPRRHRRARAWCHRGGRCWRSRRWC